MAKKMFDVLPPRLAHKAEPAAKPLASGKKKKKAPVPAPAVTAAPVLAKPQETPVPPVTYQAPKPPKKERRFPVKEIVVGFVAIVILLVIYAYVELPKADIQIWPKITVLNLQEKITADKTIDAVDSTLKNIPAQYVEVQKDAKQDFPSTGLSANDGKATGTITVYNKIDPSLPFTLIKGTHFLSDSGKYFVSLSKITVPGKRGNTPGSIDVAVQAQDVGSDYNIGSSKFSLPKLSGSAYYYSIYGASTASMSGGYTGKVKKVSDDDLQSAKDVLSKQLLDQAHTDLKNKLAKDDVLLDGATSEVVVSASPSAKSGAITDTFSESVTVKVSALLFKKQDLDALVKSDIASQVSSDSNFLENSIQTSYKPDSIDIQGGKMVLDVQANAKTYPKIDTNNLIGLFPMKSSDQIKQIVDQMYSGNVSELKVNFWPFWVTKAPSDSNKIKINLNF